MERVRREMRVGAAFSASNFERAFERFVEFYNVPPLNVLCAPDVLSRFCAIYERSADVAHLHSSRPAFRGVPLAAAVLPPGMLAFEGEVDEERMGDW